MHAIRTIRYKFKFGGGATVHDFKIYLHKAIYCGVLHHITKVVTCRFGGSANLKYMKKNWWMCKMFMYLLEKIYYQVLFCIITLDRYFYRRIQGNLLQIRSSDEPNSIATLAARLSESGMNPSRRETIENRTTGCYISVQPTCGLVNTTPQ